MGCGVWGVCSLGDESSNKREEASKEGFFLFFFFLFLFRIKYISICTVSVVGNAIHMYYCNYTQNYNARTGITIPVWDPIIVWGGVITRGSILHGSHLLFWTWMKM